MNLADIIEECAGLGVKSPRLDVYWKSFVNRAQRQIAQRRSFSFMHDQRQVTINQGSFSADLDPTFKELSSEKSPVSYQDQTVPYVMPIPCEVISRARADRMGYNPYVTPFPTLLNAFPLRYVFIERNGPNGLWKLFLPQQYQTSPSVTFTVSGYYYPADLILGSDTSGVTEHPDLCEAIINLTKALAYRSEEVDNPKALAAYQLYEQSYRHAAYTDQAQRFAGRSLKM